MTGNNPRSQSPPTPPLSPTASTASTSSTTQPSLPPVIPSTITLTGYDPPTPQAKLRGLPAEDFALHAFQTPENLQKLVRALAEHDVRKALRGEAPLDYKTWAAAGMRTTMIDEYFDLSERHEGRIHLRQGTDESNITVRPPLVKVNEDDFGSDSETERDDPKKEEGSKGKKSKKKKNKKKKKGKTVAMQVEEAEGKNRDEKEEEEVDQLLTDVAAGDSEVDDGNTEKLTLDPGAAAFSVDPDSTLVDPDATMVNPGSVSSPDMADESQGTSVTSGVSIIITPDSPAIPLPAVGAEDPTPISPILSVSRANSPKDKEDKGREHEVTVRLPSQQTTHAVITDASVNDKDKENRPPLGLANTHRPTHSRSVDLSTMVVPPLTPPHSPPDQPSRTVQPVTDSQKPLLFADQPDTPPHTAADLQDPIIASPDAMPLANTWTLYHSNTGTPLISQTAKFGITGTAGVLSASPRSKAAEEFSHGLFRLFNADNVFDLLGTWKALRRKIAHKYGRAIEPEDSPIAPDMAGLGIMLLPDDTNFHFFLASVKPMWEDPMCVNGGKIMLSGTGSALDPVFFQVILLLAGGTFDEFCPSPTGSSSMVVGVVLSKRRAHTRLEVWLGGMQPLEPDWIRAVEELLAYQFNSLKSFPFQLFGSKEKKSSLPASGGGLGLRRVQRLPSLGEGR